MATAKSLLLRKQYKKILIITSIFFFVLGIIVHSTGDFLTYRLIRGLIYMSFLSLLYVFQGKKIHSLIFIFLFISGLSSFATIGYESNWLAIISMILFLLSSLVLINAVAPKVNFRKMNTLLTVIFVVMVLIDGYLLYEFVQMIRELTLSSTHYVFTLISAMSFVFLGFLAILYNYIYSSKASLVFVLFVFTFIFAEVFRAIAYYDIAFGIASIHIARGLLLLSMCLLVHYCLLGKKDVEKLNQKLF